MLTTYAIDRKQKAVMPDEGVVYVVQQPRPFRDRATGNTFPKDLSSAQRYGKLVPILDAEDHPSLTPGPSLFQLQKKLRDFNPERDYICHAGGDPMSLALALLVLRDLNLKEVQVLRWDRERSTQGERLAGGFYVPVLTPLRF